MKPLLDRLCAFVLLVLLSPVIGCVAVLVRIFLGRPVLFSQIRPGLHARPFTLIKFRTMKTTIAGMPVPSSTSDLVLTDAVRLTGFGKLLRRASLDELPQLFNIVRGDMSFIGPRPLLMDYLPLYSAEQARRHEVRPGLTGWAQVNGRNATSWDERFAHDVWYVDNRSLRLDMRIFFMTINEVIVTLLHNKGVSQPGRATMEPFVGSPVPEAAPSANTRPE